jgi:hypothetical protein
MDDQLVNKTPEPATAMVDTTTQTEVDSKSSCDAEMQTGPIRKSQPYNNADGPRLRNEGCRYPDSGRGDDS